MNLRRASALPVLLVALTALVAACSDDKSVGSEDLLTFEQRQQQELGETTTTTVAAAATTTTTASVQAATTAPPATTAPERAPSVEIRIAGDNERSQFQPPAVRVYVASIIRWVNADTEPRSVIADNGAFNSGPIPPGGHWDYKADAPGRFNYSDGTRPYAVALVEVV
jgi:plastocyanin